MSFAVFFLLCAASIGSRSWSLRASGLAYAVLSFVHMYLFTALSGENYGYYYASASAFDAVAIGAVCLSAIYIGRDCHLFYLCVVILLSIVNNLLGLLVWFFELDSIVYRYCGVGIYFVAAFVLAGSWFNVGGLFGANRFGSFRFAPAFYRLLLDR